MDKRLSDIDLFQIYKSWKNDLGPFQCFVKSTNFVSLKHYRDFTLSPILDDRGALSARVKGVLQEHDCTNTLFLLDINGIEAIKTAFFMRNSLSIAPIPVFNGVLHPFGLVGNEEYISYLIGYGMQNRERDNKGYLFIFDSNRYGDFSEEQLKRSFNNQYELGEEDLPPVEMLQALNYERVVYFFDQVKEDLDAYLEYLSNNNISVVKVNLSASEDV